VSAVKDTGLSRELLEQIVGFILRFGKPKRIILFGSRARGDFSPASDIDLALEGLEEVSLLKELLDEQVDTLLKFDVVDLNRIPKELREEIEREGIVLYEEEEKI